MDYVYVGKLVNTHALKGEVRIVSDFSFKSRVFLVHNNLYLGKDKEKVTIESYRVHKNYDMVKFCGFNDISDVLRFRGMSVYFLKDDLVLESGEYLDSDFLGKKAIYDGKVIGKISDIINNNGYKLFCVSGKYIPYNFDFISSVGKDVVFKNLEGII